MTSLHWQTSLLNRQCHALCMLGRTSKCDRVFETYMSITDLVYYRLGHDLFIYGAYIFTDKDSLRKQYMISKIEKKIINQTENIENYIVTKNGKTSQHLKKWYPNATGATMLRSNITLDTYVQCNSCLCRLHM